MTSQEIRDLINASPGIKALIPNTTAVAAALSLNRKKLAPTQIGVNDILNALEGVGSGGGEFLDFLVTTSTSNRNVYWALELIKQDKLRIDMSYIRNSLTNLATNVPARAAAANALLTLGYIADPITEFEVRKAIYADNGTLLVTP